LEGVSKMNEYTTQYIMLFDCQLADLTSLEVLKKRMENINSMTGIAAIESQVNILQSKIHSRSQELIRLDKDILYLGTRVSKSA
jgi:predicted ATPase